MDAGQNGKLIGIYFPGIIKRVIIIFSCCPSKKKMLPVPNFVKHKKENYYQWKAGKIG